jgi:hypothetical protein
VKDRKQEEEERPGRRERDRPPLPQTEEAAAAAAPEPRDRWPMDDEVRAGDVEPAGRGEREPGRLSDAPTLPPDVRTADVHTAAEGLLGSETAGFRQEWESIQGAFVDDPRRCVERADKLVTRAASRVAERFAQERQRLEEQWGRGGDVSTEDLRLALRRYRDFFDRMLTL